MWKQLVIPLLALLIQAPLSVAYGKTEVTSDLSTPYQVIHSGIAQAIFDKAPSMFYRSCEEGQIEGYRCGEIPFGDVITGENKKRLFRITIPTQSFNKGGFSGTFPATKVDVRISRRQTDGVPVPEKLVGQSDKLVSSHYFGRDLFLRMTSNNNQLGGVACLYLPGLKTDVSDVENSFVATKKIWFFSIKARVTTKVAFDDNSFDAVKSCLAFKVMPAVDAKTQDLTYKYELVSRTKPEFMNLKYGKIHVNVNVEGANFLGSFVLLFVKSMVVSKVKKAIEKALNDKMHGIYEDDVLSGKWFAKYFDKKFNVKATTHLSEALEKSLAKPYTPSSQSLAEGYGKACGSASADLSEQLQALVDSKRITTDQKSTLESEMKSFCKDIAGVQARVFLKNKESQAAGCYTDFLRPTDFDPIIKPAIPVAKSCRFDHQLYAQVDDNYTELGRCVLDQWKFKYSKSCEPQVEALLKKRLGL